MRVVRADRAGSAREAPAGHAILARRAAHVGRVGGDVIALRREGADRTGLRQGRAARDRFESASGKTSCTWSGLC